MEATVTSRLPAGLAEGVWVVDRPHSHMGFMAIDGADLKFIAGRFSDFEGTVVVGADDVVSMSGTINVASVSTDESDRDQHLRSSDFFEADSHPVFHFTSSKVSWSDDGGVSIDGELRLKDHAEQLALGGEMIGVALDGKGNERLAFTATGTMRWGTIEVRLSLAISAIRQQ